MNKSVYILSFKREGPADYWPLMEDGVWVFTNRREAFKAHENLKQIVVDIAGPENAATALSHVEFMEAPVVPYLKFTLKKEVGIIEENSG